MHQPPRFILVALACLAAPATLWAEPTQYPLTLENCGVEITIEQAPQNAVALGQSARSSWSWPTSSRVA